MTTPVYLLHGLYLHGPILLPLARHLRRMGLRPILFDYPSLRRTPADNAEKLVAKALQDEHATAHYVGHSLGGLVLRHAIARHGAQLPPGRTVTLGTPHQGSVVARHMEQRGYGWLLGASRRQGVLGDLPEWPSERELGSLAGVARHGLGSRLAPLEPPHDGTVTVVETYCAGQRDHVCVPCNHTTMLFKAAVFHQVLAFLNSGRFRHEDTAE